MLLNEVKNNFYNIELYKINETLDFLLLNEIINILISIGLLIKKQYLS